MSLDVMRRPPVVTDADRHWAAEQEPSGWDNDVLPWSQHVAEQAERFEAHFGEDRKPYAEWSGLWRRVWWPKADPSILHPGVVPGRPHPVVRRGEVLWPRVLPHLNRAEREFAERWGVFQFKPDDPRAGTLEV